MNPRRATHWLTTLLVGALFAASAAAAERLTIATNWTAEAEHGGFYQALADGLYAERGLEVTIRQGGPMVNHRALLAAGRVDFLVGSNLVQAFDDAKQRLPTVAVAAVFQKDVHCLISTPGAGNDTWEDLKKARLLIGNAGMQTYFRWLETRHGFSRERVRPYAFSLAPFLADPRVVQQGFMTAEPKAIADALGRDPNVFLLADHGWSTYSTLVMARRPLVEEKPEVVRAFVDATVLGWVRYLYGDPSAANTLIQRDNPSMPDELLAWSRAKLLEEGIADSGDALTLGLGAMTDERVAAFHAEMVACGMYKEGEVDPKSAYTTEFVNHGVGLDEKRRLTAAASP